MRTKFFNFREVVSFANKSFGKRIFIDPLEEDFQPITYSDLDNFINCFSGFLKALEIPEMEKVAVVSGTSTIKALLFIGSIACDRVFVPINPGSTRAEVLRLLHEVTPGLIICDPTHHTHCDEWARLNGAKALVLDNGRAIYDTVLAVASPKPFRSKCCSSDIAEIVFTSGSSGTPKGVIMSHGALIANAWSLVRHHALNSNDRFLVSVPIFHFGGQIFPILCPLLLGAQTTVAEPHVALMRFWDIVDRYQITWSILITAFLPVLLQSPARRTSLKGLLVGGSAVSANLIEKFEEKFGTPVLQIYGMTEVAAVVVSERINDTSRSSGSVGQPIDIASVRVVCDDLEDVPAGTSGEVCLRSVSRYKGYYKNGAATGERELDGYIRTGDNGYIDEKGNLYILGRRDDMFNIGGENVYPAEIEAIAPKLAGVEAMIVLNIPNEATDNDVLMLYKVRQGQTSIDQVAWDRAFREHLSYYKIPRQRIEITSLGLTDWIQTGSGKIDRRSMKSLVFDYMREKTTALPPYQEYRAANLDIQDGASE